MPLIFVVLAAIVIIVSLREGKKSRENNLSDYTKRGRKTNAKRERETLDSFMKSGKTFDEAYKLTQDNLCKLGYDPCIPKESYGAFEFCQKITGADTETSYIESEQDFDSDNVKARIELLRMENIPITEENIYANYPNNYDEYVRDLKRQSLMFQAIPVGGRFTYPGYGTLEVLEHIYSKTSSKDGWLKARVISTGQIKLIRIDDSRIRKL